MEDATGDNSQERRRPEQPLANKQTEDNPQVFILSRELAGVHLLLDNISSDPGATIAAISGEDPPKGLEKSWLEDVCRISWPPDPSDRKKAEQAALLIRVKDHLNRLAEPASGASIAFTLMVTQKHQTRHGKAEDRRPGVDMDETLSRNSLAILAFPDLERRAATFRNVMWVMNCSLVLWLIVTCALSWNVAFGNGTLGEYAAAEKRLAEAQSVVDKLEAGSLATLAAAEGEETDGGATTDAAPAEQVAPSPAQVAYCERWRLVGPAVAGQDRLPRYETAEQHQACRELAEARGQVARARVRLQDWLVLWHWLPGIFPGSEAPATAARLAEILGTAVLPVFYGVLGAAAAVLRSLSHKIRASTLTPRDLSLSLQQLALGAVVGACIGLFIVGGDGEALVGPVALSVSAISFIAGFGVEAVFQALDALISRLFNIASPPDRSSGRNAS